jgi:hypothetical protein
VTKQEILRALEPFTDEVRIYVRIGGQLHDIVSFGYMMRNGEGEVQFNARPSAPTVGSPHEG